MDALGDTDNLGIGSSGKSLCSVITVKPSTVPAGWLRSRSQITNIGENRRDRFPVQSKQAEHKVTNFADTASPCHRCASSSDEREASERYNPPLNKLSRGFVKLFRGVLFRFVCRRRKNTAKILIMEMEDAYLVARPLDKMQAYINSRSLGGKCVVLVIDSCSLTIDVTFVKLFNVS